MNIWQWVSWHFTQLVGPALHSAHHHQLHFHDRSPSEPRLASSPQSPSSTSSIRVHLGTHCTRFYKPDSYLSPQQQCQKSTNGNSKHWTQPITRKHHLSSCTTKLPRWNDQCSFYTTFLTLVPTTGGPHGSKMCRPWWWQCWGQCNSSKQTQLTVSNNVHTTVTHSQQQLVLQTRAAFRCCHSSTQLPQWPQTSPSAALSSLQRYILTTAYLVRRIIRCGMAPRVRSIIARCSKLSCVCVRHSIHITTQSHWYTVLFANNKSCRYTCLILAMRLDTSS